MSELHCLAQFFEQMPLQHSSPVDVQSDDCVHAFGHGSKAGSRQSPETLNAGSIFLTDVQQTSPVLVWQVELVVHAFGHWLGGRQTD